MEWLAKFVSNLPLDDISDAVSHITLWWTQLVANVQPDILPLYAYVGFSVIVLLLWLFIVRVLPSPIGGMSWLAVFAVLLTPSMAVNETGMALSESGNIAPASIAAIYGVLLQDYTLALRNLVPILVVFTVGLLLGFIWQLIKTIVESSIEKSQERAAADERANLQLASANYIELIDSETDESAELIKTKKRH